ncbi:MAG: hypothetical protein KF851_01815 [Pirellulaceae bacterium]|jgi:hypothetical protein|nr:hypothetical protein [Pirellulaceae bacterium]
MTENSPHSSASPHDCILAIWKPGWHRLDQTIEVGQLARFWFFPRKDSEDLQPRLHFFNTTSSVETPVEIRSARIVSITHPELGPLSRIEADWLDYTFHGVNGEEFLVNADEEPGTLYTAIEPIENWTCEVILRDVSEPLSDLV